MMLEDVLEEIVLSGGLIRRKSWDEGTGLDLDDISAEDWELIEDKDEDEDD